MELQFLDTTFRDGSQSLWAAGMRPGMMEAIAEDIDQSGFKAVEVPVMPINFKKIVRDLKEDPWEMVNMLAKKMPKTTKAFMGEPAIFPFEIVGAPEAVVKLYYERIVATGVLNRVQIMANIFGNVDRLYPWYLPFLREQNLEVALALSYAVSPRHTDEYYAQKTKELVEMKPDVIYLKDQGGLLTVDRIRTLIPIILENANGIPIELHSHCTTGQAELVYLEAVKLGIRTLHTAIPPLADGSGQPSIFSTVQNAKYLGYASNLDIERLQRASTRLMEMAKQDDMPIGAPLPYDHSQFVYQIPGGVISNLRHQLKELKLENRLDEVLEETVRVREELGYPVMITPYSQFVVSQAAINVATGERYKVVIDELIQFAQGTFSEDSGYTWMDENLKDKILSLPRAQQLSTVPDGSTPLHKIREQFGGPTLSDEEFLLRYIMKGTQEIDAMRQAGPPRKYFSATAPLIQLLDNLSKQPDIKHIQIQGHNRSLLLTNN
jgi:oxaloacetate decarboxylase alpha subunit